MAPGCPVFSGTIYKAILSVIVGNQKSDSGNVIAYLVWSRLTSGIVNPNRIRRHPPGGGRLGGNGAVAALYVQVHEHKSAASAGF